MSVSETSLKSAKMAAARAAAELILPGMRVGLGSGSTAALFIEALGSRCREGLSIEAISSSEASLELARQVQIPLADPESITTLDMTIDGADEIDPEKRMIKGGGGALLREKIIAKMSREMVVIADSSKCVKALGAFPLAVEITPFCYQATLAHLSQLGYKGAMRKEKENLYVTDNGNYIFDIRLSYPCRAPEEDHRKIHSVPGVVETGFFIDLAGRVIIGYQDGRVEIKG
ncbi:MAG: ribose-5-phosphate isomerase RpiA [Parachlamydia sp.]|nr:ribose-5-phosphate isomerase RpiA [Parachlamydia sp.]